jgi:hypothetical protein
VFSKSLRSSLRGSLLLCRAALLHLLYVQPPIYSFTTNLTNSSSPLASNPTRPRNGTHKQRPHQPLRRRNRRHSHRRRRLHRPPHHLNHLLSKTQSCPSAPALAASPERTKRKGPDEEARRDALDTAAEYRADLKRMEISCSGGVRSSRMERARG